MQRGQTTDMTMNPIANDETSDLDQIFEHLDPQQWLTPSAVSWGHRDLPFDGARSLDRDECTGHHIQDLLLHRPFHIRILHVWYNDMAVVVLSRDRRMYSFLPAL